MISAVCGRAPPAPRPAPVPSTPAALPPISHEALSVTNTRGLSPANAAEVRSAKAPAKTVDVRILLPPLAKYTMQGKKFRNSDADYRNEISIACVVQVPSPAALDLDVAVVERGHSCPRRMTFLPTSDLRLIRVIQSAFFLARRDLCIPSNRFPPSVFIRANPCQRILPLLLFLDVWRGRPRPRLLSCLLTSDLSLL